MYDEAQDLRSTQADSQPVVRISHNELMDEVRAHFSLPELKESDVTVRKMVEENQVSESAIRYLVKSKLKSGEWKVIWKRDENGNRIQTYVKA